MNPENAAIRNLDRRTRTDEIKEVADKLLRNSEQVRQILNELAFDPEDFADLYEEGVSRDIRYVQDMHERFKTSEGYEANNGLTEGDIKRLSERVEYEVIRGINVGQWFEGMGAHKTSEYDDIKNGVDIVLENISNNRYSHLGLGIDVTFSQNIEKKFQRIKDEIDAYDGKNNRLARVKYFSSDNTGIRGELNGLARAVVAVDLPMLKDMTQLKDADSISNHISKHVTILEIKEQLETFIQYAEQHNPDATKPLQRSYTFICELVEDLGSEQKLEQSEYAKNRKADDAIARGLEIFSQKNKFASN
jgi:hypothetical protein